MTQVAERPGGAPLTNAVPGAWIQLPDTDIPPVYVPFEPQYRKNEATGKDIIVGHAPGAHIKRLLSEGAMYASGPDGIVPIAAAPDVDDLRTALEEAQNDRDRVMTELAELRAKMAGDTNIPNAPKRAR